MVVIDLPDQDIIATSWGTTVENPFGHAEEEEW